MSFLRNGATKEDPRMIAPSRLSSKDITPKRTKTTTRWQVPGAHSCQPLRVDYGTYSGSKSGSP